MRMLGEIRLPLRVALALLALAALLLPAAAIAAKPGKAGDRGSLRPGSLVQLSKKRGCIVDRSAPLRGCEQARALKGAGPFLGSRAIAVSPDDRHVYVASSRSNAIAIFRRLPGNGALRQAPRANGCIASKGAEDCARAVGLNGVNSVAVSADGRNVYATARGSDAVTAFRRNPNTGGLRQQPGPATGRAAAAELRSGAGRRRPRRRRRQRRRKERLRRLLLRRRGCRLQP